MYPVVYIIYIQFKSNGKNNISDEKMLESRPEDALVKLVKTVVQTARTAHTACTAHFARTAHPARTAHSAHTAHSVRTAHSTRTAHSACTAHPARNDHFHLVRYL